jgi:hypothetical protein
VRAKSEVFPNASSDQELEDFRLMESGVKKDFQRFLVFGSLQKLKMMD